MTCRHPSSNIKLIQAFSSVFWCGTNRIAGATECGCDGAQGTSGFAIVSAQNANLAFAPGLTIWWRHLVKSLAFPEDDAGVCISTPTVSATSQGRKARVFPSRRCLQDRVCCTQPTVPRHSCGAPSSVHADDHADAAALRTPACGR